MSKADDGVGADDVPVPIALGTKIKQEVFLLVVEVLAAIFIPSHAFVNWSLDRP